VLVRFAAGTTAAQRADVRSAADVQRQSTLPLRGLELVTPQAGQSVANAVSDLERHKGVMYAEPDSEVHAALVPNDSLYPQEWGLAAIGASAAWDLTTGSPQVLVAVVDTGIDASHPDLAPNLWRNPDGSGAIGYDFVDDDTQPQDDNGHGTHVSGTIDARGNDGFGVAGVSWNSTLMALRVLNAAGSGFVSDIVRADLFAAQQGARIVNESLGGANFTQSERAAIAAAPNTLFVVAAGNSASNNDTTGEYPCDYDLPNIVCVAASDRDGSLASFSNYGAANVDLSAPGVSIVSTWRFGAFVPLSGTSMATPHVSGAAALLLARNPGLSVAGLRAALLASVAPVSALSGRVVTSGELRLPSALAAAGVATPPAAAPPAEPVASPAPAPAPQQAASAADRVAPSLRVTIVRARIGAVRKRGLRVAFTVSEPSRVTVTLRVPASTRKRLRLRSSVVGTATLRVTAAGRRVVTVRLSARERRALARIKTVRLTASVVAVDPAGNHGSAAGAATLRR
jgi:subtilisin family serine protease